MNKLKYLLSLGRVAKLAKLSDNLDEIFNSYKNFNELLDEVKDKEWLQEQDVKEITIEVLDAITDKLKLYLKNNI